MMRPEVRLDIFSDPVCPWCWIGKALLDRALESAPDHPFRVTWHPFRLNPDMPRGGMDRRAYMEAKFGGQQGAVAAYLPVVQAAEAAGLALDLAAITRQPDTTDAQRLIHWAGLEGRQAAMVSALFRGYFQQGADLGDLETLATLAAQAGLDRDMIARLLASTADRDLIREADRDARARGIQGVPFFIIAENYAIPGAQSVELWQSVITELQGGPS